MFNFHRSERGNGEIAFILAICAIVVIGMVLCARNGNDPFTAFWRFVSGLMQ